MNNNTPKSPASNTGFHTSAVGSTEAGVQAVSIAAKTAISKSNYSFGEVIQAMPEECYENKSCENEFTPVQDEHLSGINFGNDIKVLCIPVIDYRIMCYFLGATSVNQVESTPYTNVPLIALLLMQTLPAFMKEKGYTYSGELNFDDRGNFIPCSKTIWLVRGNEICFSTTGFSYFSRGDDRVVFFNYFNKDRAAAGITCYTKNGNHSKQIIKDLEDYTYGRNCLRGIKIRGVNMYRATFDEVIPDKKYTWDNYYYDDDIINLFDLEVFGFLKNLKEYNSVGIHKRGLIVFGDPGTGKTTLGHIICNLAEDYTVMWITPDMIGMDSSQGDSLMVLYKLAEFVAPSIVILEDLDLYGEDRSSSHNNSKLGVLMNIMDGVHSVKDSITIGTTNRLGSIEKALRNRPGRFDRIVEIPSLKEDLRKRMIQDRTVDYKIVNSVIDDMVGKTEGWTGAEIQELINTIGLYFINKKMKSKKITVNVVDEVLSTMRKFGVGEKSGMFGFNKD